MSLKTSQRPLGGLVPSSDYMSFMERRHHKSKLQRIKSASKINQLKTVRSSNKLRTIGDNEDPYTNTNLEYQAVVSEDRYSISNDGKMPPIKKLRYG